MPTPTLSFYYSWQFVPDAMIPNIMAEFRENGVRHLVFSHIWLQRLMTEPDFLPKLRQMTHDQDITLAECHGLWGRGKDLNCVDPDRRPAMIADHLRAMRIAADNNCKTYTVHLGAFESVTAKTPNDILRPLAINTLEAIIPEAEKLDLIIALENSYERSNTPDEVVFLIEYFQSKTLGCCFDVGHANLMAPAPGKKREKYFSEMDAAWGDVIEEYPNALERLAPHIVTVHMHDNNGYEDSHNLPGTGTVSWDDLIDKLKNLPRLLTLQTETRTIPGAITIKTLAGTFARLMRRW